MFWVAIATMVVSGYYFDLQKKKLMLEKRDGANSSEVKRQLGQLMAENEELKERMRNIEYLLTEDKGKTKLDFEKEQIWIDSQNKYKY